MNVDFFIEQFSGIENPIKGVKLPHLKIEEKQFKKLNLPNNTSNYDFLRALCKRGFLSLNLPKDSLEYKAYAERVKNELSVINELGFAPETPVLGNVIFVSLIYLENYYNPQYFHHN